MDGEKGHFVFFFNHGEKAAEVELTEELGRSAANVQETVIERREKWRKKICSEDGSSGAGGYNLQD
jgi:hypothetical protein